MENREMTTERTIVPRKKRSMTDLQAAEEELKEYMKTSPAWELQVIQEYKEMGMNAIQIMNQIDFAH